MRAIFFGLLCHQANIRNASHGGRVVGALADAVFDDHFVHTGITAVWNDGNCVLCVARSIPHLTALPNHRRH